MMTDTADAKVEWDGFGITSDGENPDDFFFPDVNATALDPTQFTFDDDKFMNETFDFESASSSPDACDLPGANLKSPEFTHVAPPPALSLANGNVSRPPNHQSHFSQHSLNQSMNGLTTAGSREVSPLNMATSYNSSPSAMFNNSPSPIGQIDMQAPPLSSTTIWPNRLDAVREPNVNGSYLPQSQFNGMDANYRIKFFPIPPKSRVETQIPIKIMLSPLPPGVSKLHLPTHTIAKPKLLAKPAHHPSPEILELYTMLVCTSAMQNRENKKRAFAKAAMAVRSPPPASQTSESDEDDEDKPQNGGEVCICVGCITRERKRAARKKIKKVEEEELWHKDESRRAIVFNTHEVKEWKLVADANGPPNASWQIDAPMRIACYCRHHGEKMGFQVIFTIKDFLGRVIAQEISPSIMITDDHKTHPLPSPGGQSCDQLAPNGTAPADSASLAPSPSSTQRNGDRTLPATPQSSGPPKPAMSGSRTLSRPASPSGHSGPLYKKRKSSSNKVPIGMTMTRLNTAEESPPMPKQHVVPVPPQPSAVSPFSPSLTTFSGPESLFGANGTPNGHLSHTFSTNPPTPNREDHMLFGNVNRSASVDNLAVTMYSTPASSHPSRAPSPSSLRNTLNAMAQAQVQVQPQFNPALSGSLVSPPLGAMQLRPQPVIHKIVPSEGSKSGGIEVTVLGAGFYQGLEVMFGDQKATTTTFWGDASLVCLVPPSPSAGIVYVSPRDPSVQAPFQPVPKQQTMFRYLDDEDEKLIRMALSVLGQKMNGTMVDAQTVARRILSDEASLGWGPGGSGKNSMPASSTTFGMMTRGDVERQLLKCLELIDLDDSPYRARLDMKGSSGHTMLHLACSLGMHRFAAGLLARGAHPDARDKGGFTPMHLAAINRNPEIVRRLIHSGADSTIRSLSGLTPADVARSDDIIVELCQMNNAGRSRSLGSAAHSRASSSTSLRSLWEPMSRARPEASGAPTYPEGESPEYSSFETDEEDSASNEAEDDDDDEVDGPMLQMRRRSRNDFGIPPRSIEDNHDLRRVLTADNDNTNEAQLAEHPPSPTTARATAALRDQFAAQIQQFQQTMAVHLQNLSQFPNLPVMPVLPDYPAYAQSAQFMRRLASLVPGMSGGARTGEAGADEAGRPMDRGWWDMLPMMNAATSPPPSYEDLFPPDAGGNSNKGKEARMMTLTPVKSREEVATQAVPSSSTEGESSGLKIGRKNAITKEQQDSFIRAHQRQFKRLSMDRNLFLIWIPLLLCMLLAMFCTRCPEVLAPLWAHLQSLMYPNQPPTMSCRSGLQPPAPQVCGART